MDSFLRNSSFFSGSRIIALRTLDQNINDASDNSHQVRAPAFQLRLLRTALGLLRRPLWGLISRGVRWQVVDSSIVFAASLVAAGGRFSLSGILWRDRRSDDRRQSRTNETASCARPGSSGSERFSARPGPRDGGFVFRRSRLLNRRVPRTGLDGIASEASIRSPVASETLSQASAECSIEILTISKGQSFPGA